MAKPLSLHASLGSVHVERVSPSMDNLVRRKPTHLMQRPAWQMQIVRCMRSAHTTGWQEHIHVLVRLDMKIVQMVVSQTAKTFAPMNKTVKRMKLVNMQVVSREESVHVSWGI